MIDVLKSLLLLGGATFTLLAAVGIVRLPDLLTRMHAATKCATLGVMLVMAGVALHFAEEVVVARAMAIMLFVMLTAPVAAHVLGRAGYFVGVKLWDGTVKDELRPNYNPLSHRLHSRLDPGGGAAAGKDAVDTHEDVGSRPSGGNSAK